MPAELLFTEEHEWVRKEGNNRVTVGITDYAQKELGDVVYVDLPAVGQKVTAKAPISTIESVKAVSDVYAPVSGEVVEVNDDLQHSPELINQDPYGKGWIAVIELDGDSGLGHLLTAAKYAQMING